MRPVASIPSNGRGPVASAGDWSGVTPPAAHSARGGRQGSQGREKEIEWKWLDQITVGPGRANGSSQIIPCAHDDGGDLEPPATQSTAQFEPVHPRKHLIDEDRGVGMASGHRQRDLSAAGKVAPHPAYLESFYEQTAELPVVFDHENRRVV